jgi:hypothetical protein
MYYVSSILVGGRLFTYVKAGLSARRPIESLAGNGKALSFKGNYFWLKVQVTLYFQKALHGYLFFVKA